MRIIARSTIAGWSALYPDAAKALESWCERVEESSWESIVDVRRVFPHADAVTVASGRVVAVFNIRGNNYRLVTAIHYRGQRVYVLRFMTHKEYDEEKWKREL